MGLINSIGKSLLGSTAAKFLTPFSLELKLFQTVSVLVDILSNMQKHGFDNPGKALRETVQEQLFEAGKNGRLSLPIFDRGHLNFDFIRQNIDFSPLLGRPTSLWSQGNFGAGQAGYGYDLGNGLHAQFQSSGQFGDLIDQLLFTLGQQQLLVNGLGQGYGRNTGPTYPPYHGGHGVYEGHYVPGPIWNYFFSPNGPAQNVDGSGNNLFNSDWGQAHTPLGRLTDRRIGAIFDPTLPNPRAISNAIFDQSGDVPNTHGTTDFLWLWGQFIDHDLSLSEPSEGAPFVPIAVPGGDPDFGGGIIPFSRVGTENGEIDNEITSWIDASSVYGSDEERAAALRVEGTPFLKLQANGNLPYNEAGLPNANPTGLDPDHLYLAGDVRANENPGLTGLHTVFAREHNRVAAIIQRDNPHMSNDQVFDSARRVVEAQIQKVTYDEFIPALTGSELPEYQGYDPSVDPTLSADFTTAAFRFGHSAVGDIPLVDKEGNQIGTLDLSEQFFNPEFTDFEDLFRGAAGNRHQEIDTNVVDDLRNQLFGQPGQGGMDLVSLNIQRGRDVELGTYNDLRASLGFAEATSFADITSDPALQAKLSEAYGGDVSKVDQWVGLLAEDDAAGSQLGVTATTVIRNQFQALRDGDRTYWENNGALSAYERQFVENSSLSNIITSNTNIKAGELQDNVFHLPTHQPAPEPDYPGWPGGGWPSPPSWGTPTPPPYWGPPGGGWNSPVTQFFGLLNNFLNTLLNWFGFGRGW